MNPAHDFMLLRLPVPSCSSIIHRDLKPENILLDANVHCKLADFGMYMDGILEGKTTNTFYGTPNYTSPEMIQGWKYRTSVDWWALIMYEMMTGYDLFHDDNQEKMYKSIVNAEPHYPSNLCRKAVSILKAFLRKKPKNCLGCMVSQDKEEAIKHHPFFKKIKWVLAGTEEDCPFSTTDYIKEGQQELCRWVHLGGAQAFIIPSSSNPSKRSLRASPSLLSNINWC